MINDDKTMNDDYARRRMRMRIRMRKKKGCGILHSRAQ